MTPILPKGKLRPKERISFARRYAAGTERHGTRLEFSPWLPAPLLSAVPTKSILAAAEAGETTGLRR